MPWLHRSILFVTMGVIAFSLSACEGSPTDLEDTGMSVALAVQASMGSENGMVAVIAVEVTGQGVPVPIVANFQVVDGMASGVIQVPAGQDRTFTARGFDSEGSITHEGAVTRNVRPNGPPVQIPLVPRGVGVPIEVTVSHRVITIAPATADLIVGQTLAFTATLQDSHGNPIDFEHGDLTWGSSNPSVALVDADGVVTGWHAGETRIVVSFDGVAAEAVLEVTGEDLLRISLTSSHQSVAPSGPFTVSAVVTNRGSESVANVLFSVGAWPIAGFNEIGCIGTEFPYADRDGFAVWGCEIGELAPGQSASFAFDIAATSDLCVNHVQAESSIISWDGPPDPLLLNNAATAQTQIDCPQPITTAQRIVFAARHEGVSNLYSMDPDGTGLSQLTDHPGEESYPAWSPDRTRIAFIRDEQLWVMNSNGTGATQLGSATAGLSWSPDGTRIVVSAPHPDISRLGLRVVTLETATSSWLTSDESVADLRHPDWSPDGERILVELEEPADEFSFCFDGVQETVRNIAVVGVADGSIKHIALEFEGMHWPGCEWFGTDPRWSPDGSQLAYVEDDQVFTLDLEPTGFAYNLDTVQLVTTGTDVIHRRASWSPDGSYLTFARRSLTGTLDPDTGDYVTAFDIGIMRADGTGPLHNATNRHTGHDMMPGW